MIRRHTIVGYPLQAWGQVGNEVFVKDTDPLGRRVMAIDPDDVGVFSRSTQFRVELFARVGIKDLVGC
jgi:hypothetical protein